MAASTDEENNFYLFLSNNPVRFEPLSKVTTIFFDELNRQVFTVRLNGLAVVAKGPEDKTIMFSLPDKGELRSIKFSSDLKVLALQRSPRSVDFMNFMAGTDVTEYTQTCKGKCANILSFYWMGLYEIVYVTDQGIEYYQVLPEKKTLKLIKAHTLPVGWSTSLGESSVILLSSSTNGNVLFPFHFKAGIVTRLPKFEVELLPALSAQPPTSGLAQTLKQTDVTLATLYGQLYAIVLRRDVPSTRGGSSSELVLYQIHTNKDAPVARRTDVLQLDLDGQFNINVLDNLIVVHHFAAKTSMIFDIKASSKSQEIGVTRHQLFLSPLPIRPFRLAVSGVSNSGATEVQECNCELYSSSWVIFQPDIVLDAKIGCFWSLNIKLEPLVSMITDKPRLVEFLLVRCDSKPVILDLCRSIVSPGKRCSLSDVGVIFDSLNRVYSHHVELETSGSYGRLDTNDRKTPVIDQSDVYTRVFSIFDETNPQNVVSVTTEYIRSLGLFQIPVQHYILELLIKTLVDNKRFYQLHQLLQYHVLSDSKELAFYLLSRESSYQPSYQLALDMLKRLGTANDSILEVLLSKQQLLSAIRFIQSTCSVDQASARRFLEAALLSDDDRLFYTVFRFFEQRNLRLRANTRFLPGEHCDVYVERFKEQFGCDALG